MAGNSPIYETTDKEHNKVVEEAKEISKRYGVEYDEWYDSSDFQHDEENEVLSEEETLKMPLLHVGLYYDKLECAKKGSVIELFCEEDDYAGYSNYVAVDEVLVSQSHSNELMPKGVIVLLVKGVIVNSFTSDLVETEKYGVAQFYYTKKDKEKLIKKHLVDNKVVDESVIHLVDLDLFVNSENAVVVEVNESTGVIFFKTIKN